MAIQIIDGFQVNTASPIDNRIVASGSAARNAIPYKYHGLRVFDISNNVPYVWNGSSWISENASGIVGTGNPTTYAVFNTSSSLTSGILYEDGDSVKTDDVGGGGGLIELDAYNGVVNAAGGFIGFGNLITQLNAGNISSGSLALSRLTNGSTGWLLSGGTPNPAYINPTTISVGTASISTSSSITPTTNNQDYFLPFVASGAWTSTYGTQPLRANPGANTIKYNPSTNVLTAGTVSANGIKFPNSQISSADPNTLDDYEEGTWTPIITNLPMSGFLNFNYTSDGRYTKIGRVIHLSGYIKFTSLPTGCPSSPADYYIDISSISSSPFVGVGSWTLNNFAGSTPLERTINIIAKDSIVINSQINSNTSRIYITALDPCTWPSFSSNKVLSFSITLQV